MSFPQHERLLQDAKDAAQKLYNDSSVEFATTLSSLQDLREYVNELIDAARTCQ